MLEVRNLVKKYGDKTAINGLDFTVESGEIVGLLGLNGAGKSTTMNCITGYLAPTEGTVAVDGFDLVKEPDKAKKLIGYLPEVFSYYSDMKIDEYLNFVCDLKGFTKNRKERKQHIENVCRKVGIGEISGRMIRNLSKGYKQRVGFAQALIGNPRVLILDEPTVGLDPSQIIEIRQLIRDSGKESTVIVSSHILSEIQSICSRIIVIHDGKIAADGTPEQLTGAAVNLGELTISVRSGNSETEKVLENLSCISVFSQLPDPEEGTVKYLLKGNGDRDIREEVFRTFAAAGIPLLQMSLKETSLENTFLHLTGQDSRTEHFGSVEPAAEHGGKI
ncbi:MAG: ABC transporter ATP-binding protein [Parasporobacterium sp.]|nr:ABC transporter ATP-binding protein [Parasporobacterium sp.]